MAAAARADAVSRRHSFGLVAACQDAEHTDICRPLFWLLHVTVNDRPSPLVATECGLQPGPSPKGSDAEHPVRSCMG